LPPRRQLFAAYDIYIGERLPFFREKRRRFAEMCGNYLPQDKRSIKKAAEAAFFMKHCASI
jgi:hypothetical protein